MAADRQLKNFYLGYFVKNGGEVICTDDFPRANLSSCLAACRGLPSPLSRNKPKHMLKSITLLLLFTLNAMAAYAQPARATLTLSDIQSPSAIQVPLQEVTPFLAFSATWEGTEGPIHVRFSEDGQRWGEWALLQLDGHAEQTPENRVSELYFAPAGSRWVEVDPLSAGMEAMVLHFFNPGDTRAQQQKQAPSAIGERSPVYCPCPQPPFEGRDDWCPSGTCPPDPTPVGTNPTHLIIHHSAGTNTSNDWAAVVRAIWDFHTGVNGWDDVGYNWLIDPNGVLYEGRGDDRLGAHFCGTNGATMGVCVMGDYTNISPTTEAKATLAHLLAWKSCDINVDPQGTALHSSSNLQLMRISGHRDGCSTACPGDAFYPELPDIRDAVVAFIDNLCAAIAPPRNLMATVAADTSVMLEWLDESDNETAFLVERANSFFGDYVQIGEAPENTATYRDTTVELNDGYYYQVRATTGTDTSLYTNKAFAFIVNTQELLQGQQVTVFPNPVESLLQVSWEAPLANDLQGRLLDARGAALREFRWAGGALQQELQLNSLPTGVYWLELSNNGQRVTYRVLKK